ncbi:MAG: WD40 repeat domain-containing protein [Candidatus Xenobiia bacterium LiM19]
MSEKNGISAPSCSICGTIPESCDAYIKGGDIIRHLPEAVSRLEIWSEVPPGHQDHDVSTSDSHVKRCPECGAYFLYSCSYEYLVNGSDDEVVITRVHDPVEILKILLIHTPSPLKASAYRQQTALFIEESDLSIRRLIRDRGKEARKELKKYHHYASHLSGKDMDEAEVADTLLDLYSYVERKRPSKKTSHNSDRGADEDAVGDSTALTDITFIEEQFRSGADEEMLDKMEQLIQQSGTESISHPSGLQISKNILKRLQNIIIRYRSFLAAHPDAVFQTLYNAAFWQDCPEASRHYRLPLGLSQAPMPWKERDDRRISTLAEIWRAGKSEIWRAGKSEQGRTPWLRACKPLSEPYGSSIQRCFYGHTKDPAGARFISDGSEVVSWTGGGELIRWNAMTGEESLRFSIPTAVSSAVASADGSMTGAICKDGTVRVWSVDGREIFTAPLPKSYYAELHFQDLSSLLIKADSSEIWNIELQEKISVIPGFAEQITSDGAFALFRNESCFTVYDIQRSREHLRVEKRSEDHSYSFNGVMSDDGKWLAVTCSAKKPVIRVYDILKGQIVTAISLPEPTKYPSLIKFSPDGRFLLSSQGTGHGLQYLRVWHWLSKKMLFLHKAVDYVTVHCAFSPDGASLAVADMMDGIRVFDISTGRPLCRFHGHRNLIKSLHYREEGTTLITSSSDRTVRLWELRFERHLIPRGHSTPAVDIHFSPDRKELLSRSSGEICLWDAATGEILLVLRGSWIDARYSEDESAIITVYRDDENPSYDFTSVWDGTCGDLISRDFNTREMKPCHAYGEKNEPEIRHDGKWTTIKLKTGSKASFHLPEKIVKVLEAGLSLGALTEDGQVLLFRIEA